MSWKHFYSGIYNYIPGSGFIDFHNDNLVVASSRGILAYSKDIEDELILKQIENNINEFIGIEQFNSVQSQYPGPANLVQEEGKLALDELSWDFGYHGIIGFRHQQPDSFYYFEIRPMFHQFNYESGEGLLKEFDSFTLESLQFQIGIGTNLFK